jgi:hypothetical protein
MEDKRILYGLIIAIVVLFGTTSALGYLFFHSSQKLSEANTVISAHVDEIQEFDRKLGISDSNLRTKDDLVKKHKKELKALGKDFTKLTKKHKLDIQSRERTIAGLRGAVKGGNTSVTVSTPSTSTGEFTAVIEVTKEMCNNVAIAYQWEDEKQRFKLKDPDIFKENDESFEYSQHFEIKGYVFTDKTGNIQVKKVELKEVSPVTRDGEETVYEEVDGSDITLVSSKFEYTNKIQNEKHLFDMVTLRPIATFDTAATPGLGIELVNLGRYLDYVNLGLYGKLAFDVSDPLGGSLQNSRIGLGLNYHIIPPMLDTNFAIGASMSTPFNDIGQLVLSVDIILYLTDDLNPFQWLK